MSIVTLDSAKAHLNIVDDDADDTLIQDKIDAAEAWIASFIGVALDDADEFPNGTPEPLKEAVRQLVAAWYEQREASVIGNSLTVRDAPFSVTDLLRPYRKHYFGYTA